jgi:hypothetical protein
MPKILLVSYHFKPYNTIGSVRVTKLAEYWLKKGYDVKVVSCSNQPFTKTLASSFPGNRVVYTDYLNVNAIPEKFIGGKEMVAVKGFSSRSTFISFLGRIYKILLNFPDGQIGWYLFAIKASKKIIYEGWKPDFIYASAHPPTTFLIARRIASKFDIPWVAEYRDLWTDSPYYEFPNWRKLIESKLERFIMCTASAAVTVSEPLAQILKDKLICPVSSILNGYDPADRVVSLANKFPKDKLNIVYTGMIYKGKRDPSSLFLALKKMKRSNNVHVYFYGRNLDWARNLAVFYGVEHLVSFSNAVSYAKAIEIQGWSDVLLLLLWNSSYEKGVYTGKLFEYFGAAHPILVLGAEDGVAANLVKLRNAGFVSNDPHILSQQLDFWVDKKLENSNFFKLNKNVRNGLTRKDQFIKLDDFLVKSSLLKEF